MSLDHQRRKDRNLRDYSSRKIIYEVRACFCSNEATFTRDSLAVHSFTWVDDEIVKPWHSTGTGTEMPPMPAADPHKFARDIMSLVESIVCMLRANLGIMR